MLLEDRDPVQCAAAVRGIASHQDLGTVGGDNEGQQEYGEDNKNELREVVICGDRFALGANWTHAE